MISRWLKVDLSRAGADGPGMLGRLRMDGRFVVTRRAATYHLDPQGGLAMDDKSTCPQQGGVSARSRIPSVISGERSNLTGKDSLGFIFFSGQGRSAQRGRSRRPREDDYGVNSDNISLHRPTASVRMSIVLPQRFRPRP